MKSIIELEAEVPEMTQSQESRQELISWILNLHSKDSRVDKFLLLPVLHRQASLRYLTLLFYLLQDPAIKSCASLLKMIQPLLHEDSFRKSQKLTTEMCNVSKFLNATTKICSMQSMS